jgi:hypothetical protein
MLDQNGNESSSAATVAPSKTLSAAGRSLC